MRNFVATTTLLLVAFGCAVSASRNPFDHGRPLSIHGLTVAGENFARLKKIATFSTLNKLEKTRKKYASELEKNLHEFSAQELADSSSSSSSSSSDSSSSAGFDVGLSVFHDSEECGPASVFHAASLRLSDVCNSVNLSFAGAAFRSRSAANKAYEAFCTSPCAGSLVGALSLSVSDKCLDEDTRKYLKAVLSLCQKDESGDYCGAVLFGATAFNKESVCDKYVSNETQCKAESTKCLWLQNECTNRVTDADLEGLCGACYRGLTTAMGGQWDWIKVCLKAEGKFCLPLVEPLLSDRYFTLDLSGASLTDLDKFCGASNGPLQTCLLLTLNAERPDFYYFAEVTLKKCMENVPAVSSDYCFSVYASIIREYHASVNSFVYSCSKNSGSYCLAIAADTTYTGVQCAGLVIETKTCSAACDTEIGSLATKAGCCLHDIAVVNEDYELTELDIPRGVSLRDVTVAAMTGEGPDFGLLTTCKASAAKVTSALASSCIPRGSRSAVLSFDINLNYASVSEDQELMDLILESLAIDIATSSQLVPEDIVNITIKENIVIKGATVTFQVWGEVNVKTRVAAVILSNLLALDVLPLSMTEHQLATECGVDCFTDWPLLYSDFTFEIEGAPEDICMRDGFFQLAVDFFDACDSKVTRVFTDDFANVADAQDAWNDFCTSQCFANGIGLRTSRYGDCIDQETIDVITIAAVSCTKDKSPEKYYCGAVIGQVGAVECEPLGEKACKASPECDWLTKVNRCTSTPSQGFLDSICGGGCVPRMVGALAATTSELAGEALFLQQVICSKDGDGSYCVPLINEESETILESGYTEQVVSSLCESGPKGRCYRRIWSGVSELSRRSAEDTFIQCAADVFSSMSLAEAEFFIVYHCLSNFIDEISSVEQLAAQVDQLCVRNADGDYCSAFLAKYGESTCLWNTLLCDPSYSWYGCQCDEDCVDELEAIVKDMGCCIGNLQSIYGAISGVDSVDPAILPSWDSLAPEAVFDESLFAAGSSSSDASSSSSFSSSSSGHSNSDASGSSASSASSSSSSSASSESGSSLSESSFGFDFSGSEWNFPVPSESVDFVLGGLFANLQYCYTSATLSNINSVIGKQCAKVLPAESATFGMPLGLSYETLSGDEKLMKRLLDKMANDLGNFGGVSAEDMTPSAKADSTRRIVTGSANRRQMTTMATSPATQVSVKMTTQNPQDSKAASSQLSAAQANKTLVLPSTVKAVSNECKNCAGPGGAASLQSGADLSSIPQSPSARNTTSTSSGTAAFSAVATVVVAAFALLF
jgi:hypothetical protein